LGRSAVPNEFLSFTGLKLQRIAFAFKKSNGGDAPVSATVELADGRFLGGFGSSSPLPADVALAGVFGLTTVAGGTLTHVGANLDPANVGTTTALSDLSAPAAVILDDGIELIIRVAPPTFAYTVEDLFVIALVQPPPPAP
jgi:hypothetical protein